MKLAVILAAAGSSRRYTQSGGIRSKLEEDLGGRPVLQRTVELFTKLDLDDVNVGPIIVAGPADEESYTAFCEHHADRLSLLGAKVCRGGVTHRWETIRNALALVPADSTLVAIHDAARPCTPPALVARVVQAAARHGAAVPAVDTTDTIKRAVDTDAPAQDLDPLAGILGVQEQPTRLRIVQETLDRTGLIQVQTPQVFARDLLARAYAQTDLTSTDDASLVERLGHQVVVVEGDALNIKITRPRDLDLARAILGVRAPEGRATHKKF